MPGTHTQRVAETDISAAKRPEWQQNGAFLAFPGGSDAKGPVPIHMNAPNPLGIRLWPRGWCAFMWIGTGPLVGQATARTVALGDCEFVTRMRPRPRLESTTHAQGVAEIDISAAKRPEWQQNGAFLAFPGGSDAKGPVPIHMNAPHPLGIRLWPRGWCAFMWIGTGLLVGWGLAIDCGLVFIRKLNA